MNKLGLRLSYAMGLFFRKNICKPSRILRNYSQVSNERKAAKIIELQHRKLISLEGRDAANFMQGIVTNDVTLLPEMSCMYAMVLNQHGRVVHDVMLYHRESKSEDAQHILVECDALSRESLMKMFKLYKLRKKLSITPSDIKVAQALTSDPKESILSTFSGVCGHSVDPRAPVLGHRILSESFPNDITTNELEEYHSKRILNGIPEGTLDLPPGGCLPLECNLDYMNGVSFHKGCYIGQELTARTKFTGVIRKRLLPVTFKGDGKLEPGDAVVNKKGKKAGKLRSIYRDLNMGLALVRLSYLNDALFSKSGEFEFRCHVPSWWPSKDGSEFSDGVCGPNSNS